LRRTARALASAESLYGYPRGYIRGVSDRGALATAWPRLYAIGLLAALWWLLSGGDPHSWIIGVPAVLGAYWQVQSRPVKEKRPISLIGLLRFAPYFVWESLRGGLDVALRTLAPHMRIQPGFRAYRTQLRRPDARVFFANCVCLLPGTLAADCEGDRVQVHQLDARFDTTDDLRLLEQAVLRIYPETN